MNVFTIEALANVLFKRSDIVFDELKDASATPTSCPDPEVK